LQSLSVLQLAGVMAVRAVSATFFSVLAFPKRKIRVDKQEFRYGPHRDERLDELMPEDPGLRPHEAVIYIHGGGWISCDKRFYPADLQFLCDAGYRVFNLEYPLAPEHPHPLLLQSILRAVAWIKQERPDIRTVHMMGDSAGANLAAMYGVLFCNSRLLAHLGGGISIGELLPPKTIVSLYGLLDRGTLIGDDPDQLKPAVRLFLQSYGGPDALKPGAISPEKAITPMDLDWQDHPPCFLGVGDIDFLRDSSDLYAGELGRRGIVFEHKIYPGAPHGFFNMRHAQTPGLKRDVLSFLDSNQSSTHLGIAR
jgi:acetyl esterase/lipase